MLENLLAHHAPAISPLPMDRVVFFDRFHFPENNAAREAQILSVLLDGIYDEKTIHIKYHPPGSQVISGEFRPVVLEFSKRNNYFQGFFQECGSNRIRTMNISRIEIASKTETSFDYKAAEKNFLAFRKRNTTSVEIEFYDVKNLADRILTEFSPWEKRCSYNPDTELYRLKIFYQKQDEKELAIRLLEYGANLRFTDKSHPIYRNLQSRITQQMKLIHKEHKTSCEKKPAIPIDEH